MVQWKQSGARAAVLVAAVPSDFHFWGEPAHLPAAFPAYCHLLVPKIVPYPRHLAGEKLLPRPVQADPK